MEQFLPGQRWLNDAELQLGLGIVVGVEHRHVQIAFPASDEIRTYARNNSPLTRVIFGASDPLEDAEGKRWLVSQRHEVDGLYQYDCVDDNGSERRITEAELNPFMVFTSPTERLLNGQIDGDRWFRLRHRCWHAQQQLASSSMRGLLGCRAQWVPHQLYIAHEVGRRHAPRVLLADEVGLGKTIEAGLILHQQLVTERARRVLILVPESLQHQWLVEMQRRFNLRFSLFNADRLGLDSVMGDGVTDNPFLDEQWVISSPELLLESGNRDEVLEAGWDLLIVDEAHHLHWDEQGGSDSYQLVDSLAQQTPGVLLLTATPEQLGKTSHFARLRLLDPARFNDYEAFLEQEAQYKPIADELDILMAEGADPAAIDDLLDQYGTGRVLFRNTRSAIAGFPERVLAPQPLPLPEPYQDFTDQACPEYAYSKGEASDWTQFDPRVEWLINHCKQNLSEKQLLICAHAETALSLAEALRVKAGLHVPVFHEGMSLVERDRAAAYFAEAIDGAPLLLCSEIGSEGRNFQFAHQLILFDLPQHPDLLEQRIGRLDRIGQSSDITIHVPYLQGSEQEALFHWYHQGLDAFSQPCAVGDAVLQRLPEFLQGSGLSSEDNAEKLSLTQSLRAELVAAMESGRDRLLEAHSCRPEQAQELVERAQQEQRSDELIELMETAWDCYGVDSDPHSEQALVLFPGEHMDEPFPGVPDEGVTVTWDRDKALAQEDLQFLTWEHPMVSAVLERATSEERGNSALISLKTKALPAGTLLMEALFVLDAPRPVQRWLAPQLVRVLINPKGVALQSKIGHDAINQVGQRVRKPVARQVIKSQRDTLLNMIPRARAEAEKDLPTIREQALQSLTAMLGNEQQRLQKLAQKNPTVRQEEIDFYQREQQRASEAIAAAGLRMDAIRLIVTTQ